MLVHVVLVQIEARSAGGDFARGLLRHCLHTIELAFVGAEPRDMTWLIAFKTGLCVDRWLRAVSRGMVAVAVAALGGRLLGLIASVPGLGVVCGILPESFASFALALAFALEETANPCDELLVVLVAVSLSVAS